MALVRKDLKIGLLAGALLLVLAVGYVLVLTFSGDPIDPPVASADPPADGGLADPAPPIVDSPGSPPPMLMGSKEVPSEDDEWSVLGFDGKPPHVTQTPTGNEPLLPDAPLEDLQADTPNLNEPPVVEPRETLEGIASGIGSAAPLPQGPEQLGGVRTHVVASGDNFSSIAARYYGDSNLFALIQKANPSVDSRRLKIGQKLLIPEQPATTETAPGGAVAPVTPPAGAGPATDGTYTVVAGDTLGGIAEKHLGRELLWQEIYKLNRDVIGDDPANLKVGMKLKLPK